MRSELDSGSIGLPAEEFKFLSEKHQLNGMWGLDYAHQKHGNMNNALTANKCAFLLTEALLVQNVARPPFRPPRPPPEPRERRQPLGRAGADAPHRNQRFNGRKRAGKASVLHDGDGKASPDSREQCNRARPRLIQIHAIAGCLPGQGGAGSGSADRRCQHGHADQRQRDPCEAAPWKRLDHWPNFWTLVFEVEPVIRP